MEQLLERHFAGESLRELADDRGCSHETIAKEIREVKRERLTHLAGQLLLARREGVVLPVATIPDTSGPGFHLGLRWVDWLVGELAELTFRCRIHIEPIEGGFAVALSDAEGGAQ